MTFTQIATLEPGDIVLDYSTWRPTHEELRAIGAKAVIRYIADRTRINGVYRTWAEVQANDLLCKLVTLPEIQYLHAGGFGVLLVYESFATRAAIGFVGGITDGRFSNDVASEFVYPLGCAIAAADDTNETAPTLPRALDYQRGFDGQLDHPSGPYGDNDIMQACVDAGVGVGILWYAGARSWSSGNPPIAECHVEQRVKGSVAGKYDMNVVLRPLNVWLPHEVVEPPIPHPPSLGREDDMLIRVIDDGAVLLVRGETIQHVAGDDYPDLAGMYGNPIVVSRPILKRYWLDGAAPDYSQGDGGLPGRTVASDFRGPAPVCGGGGGETIVGKRVSGTVAIGSVPGGAQLEATIVA